MFVCFTLSSTDKLWDLAAAEVQSQERSAGEDAGAGAEAGGERTVFLMGSKAGVCLG